MRDHLLDFHGDEYPLDWNWVSIKAKGMQPEDINPHDIDCLILFGHPEALSAKALDRIHDYWQCGGSLAAVRIADFAFAAMPGSPTNFSAANIITSICWSRPKSVCCTMPGIIRCCAECSRLFCAGGLHRYELPLTDATPILFGSASGETLPVAWVRSKLGRRVFATTLGSPADFRHPCFLRLLANAVIWTAR